MQRTCKDQWRGGGGGVVVVFLSDQLLSESGDIMID